METKQLGVIDVKVKAAADDGFGEWEAVLSAPTLDRDGEIIDAGAFNPLPAKINIDTDHSMTVAGTVGSGVPFYDGDLLKMRGTFASTPKAQEVRTLVREGHVDRMSVTFMNAKREEDEDDGKTHIRSAELLNAAFVPIPSNREAAVLAAKSVDLCAKCAAPISPPADPEASGASPDDKSGDAPVIPPAEVSAGARLVLARALATAAEVA